VESLAEGGEEEEARLELQQAEIEGRVDQALLDTLAPLMCQATGRSVIPALIPFGRNPEEQGTILQRIADIVPPGRVSFDLTHGFRHLGMVGFLSAFMLQRIQRMEVDGLWYGALDMTDGGVTPVLRLDGLSDVQSWIDALDGFDATGDYGRFAPLLEKDGVASDKVRCLEEAAYFERTFNVRDAASRLHTFMQTFETPFAGASGLFQSQLGERLAWIKERGLAKQQAWLARQYLGRRDFVRGVIFAWESLVSRACEIYQHDPSTYEGRKNAQDDYEVHDMSSEYKTLLNLRNAIAHGTPHSQARYRKLLKDPGKLESELKRVMQELLD